MQAVVETRHDHNHLLLYHPSQHDGIKKETALGNSNGAIGCTNFSKQYNRVLLRKNRCRLETCSTRNNCNFMRNWEIHEFYFRVYEHLTPDVPRDCEWARGLRARCRTQESKGIGYWDWGDARNVFFSGKGGAVLIAFKRWSAHLRLAVMYSMTNGSEVLKADVKSTSIVRFFCASDVASATFSRLDDIPAFSGWCSTHLRPIGCMNCSASFSLAPSFLYFSTSVELAGFRRGWKRTPTLGCSFRSYLQDWRLKEIAVLFHRKHLAPVTSRSCSLKTSLTFNSLGWVAVAFATHAEKCKHSGNNFRTWR